MPAHQPDNPPSIQFVLLDSFDFCYRFAQLVFSLFRSVATNPDFWMRKHVLLEITKPRLGPAYLFPAEIPSRYSSKSWQEQCREKTLASF